MSWSWRAGNNHTSRRLKYVLGSCLLAALGVGGAIQVFASPGDGAPSKIDACIHIGNGVVRVLDRGDSCGKQERPLSWNTEGPPGPQGQPGFSGIQVVSAKTERGFEDYKAQTVTCPEGTVLVSGGAGLFFPFGSPLIELPQLVSSFRYPDDNTWYAEATRPAGSTVEWFLLVQATCATLPS